MWFDGTVLTLWLTAGSPLTDRELSPQVEARGDTLAYTQAEELIKQADTDNDGKVSASSWHRGAWACVTPALAGKQVSYTEFLVLWKRMDRVVLCLKVGARH